MSKQVILACPCGSLREEELPVVPCIRGMSYVACISLLIGPSPAPQIKDK